MLSNLVVDVAAKLINVIKKAMLENNMLSALEFEIKKAFDNVSRIRLIKQLLDQKFLLLLA